MTAVLSSSTVPVMRRFVLDVHVPRFAADEGFVNFHFAAKLVDPRIVLQWRGESDAA